MIKDDLQFSSCKKKFKTDSARHARTHSSAFWKAHFDFFQIHLTKTKTVGSSAPPQRLDGRKQNRYTHFNFTENYQTNEEMEAGSIKQILQESRITEF